MKHKISRLILLLIVVSGIGLCMLPYMRTLAHDLALKPHQEKLAEEFGVHIEDYPYAVSFPVGYFDSILKPGMTVDEVHEVVKGYERVYRCFHNSAELYYYYSLDADKAIVFLVSYDTNRRFEELRSVSFANRNAQPVGPIMCKPGFLLW